MYVREAHPTDGWAAPANRKGGINFEDPETLEERQQLAKQCTEALGLTMPVLVDTMDDAVSRSYVGWPERLYVVSKEGKIAYAGDPGPRGFNPGELEAYLEKRSGD